ncbi:hypothetical protein Bca4012_044917 [Brassica carinata]
MCFNVSIYKTNCVEMLRPCNHCFVETRENKGESRCLRQAQKLPVGGRLKQKRELANLGNMQVKEAEKSNKCKKRKVDTDYDDDSEASGTSSLVPEFTLNQKEIIRPVLSWVFQRCLRRCICQRRKQCSRFMIQNGTSHGLWSLRYSQDSLVDGLVWLKILV